MENSTLKKENNNNSKGHEDRTSVYILTGFAALGGLMFGYDSGTVSGALLSLTPYFELDTVWTGGIVSATVGSAAFFSLLAGISADYLGRRKTIMIATFLFTVGACVMAASPSKEVLLLGRIIVGAGIGIHSMTLPVYIAEAAPADVRGRLVSMIQLNVTIGIVVSALVAGAFSLREADDTWRYMLGLVAIPGTIQFIGFLFLTESPRWLLAKGRVEEAKKVLIRIRRTTDIQQELDDIQENLDNDNKQNTGDWIVKRIFKTPHVRKALFIGCALMQYQQLCGINTVIYYSSTILKMSGFPPKYAVWLVLIPNTVNFLSTFIGMFVVEKLGRKILIIGSLIGVVLALCVIGAGFQLSATHSPPINKTVTEFYDNRTLADTGNCLQYSICQECIDDKACGFCSDDPLHDGTCVPQSIDSKRKEADSLYGRCNDTTMGDFTYTVGYCPTDYAWIAILGLTLFLLGFAPGLGPMPWAINSEIYPLWARGTCIAIAAASNWSCNLYVAFAFLILTEVMTPYGTFYLLAGISLTGVLFVLTFVPETKGKTLEQVEQLFMTKQRRDLQIKHDTYKPRDDPTTLDVRL